MQASGWQQGNLIRLGTPADLESMYQLDRLCFEPPFRFSRVSMQRFAEEEGAFTLLVEAPSETLPATLAAFLIVQVDYVSPRHQAYIVTLDVAPQYRRRGLAHRLLTAAERRAAVQGATLMALHVWTENTPAIAFYERSGYTRIVLHPNLYASGKDAFSYLKTLSNVGGSR